MKYKGTENQKCAGNSKKALLLGLFILGWQILPF
jgi:hypothetical protein